MKRATAVLFASVAALVSGALSTGCANDLSGIWSASRTGALLDPAALREHPLATIRAACGAREEEGGMIVRLPYVESIDTGSAHLGWTSQEPAGESVSVWRAGETARRTLPARLVTTRYLGADIRQFGARLDGLEPRTIYCYELLGEGGGRVFGPSGFQTAPSADMSDRVDIAIFGDSGNGSADQQAVIDQLQTVPIDFVLHVGDLAYPNGTMAELEAYYFAMYAPLNEALPFFTAIGDHDDVTDEAGPYREALTLPDNGGLGASERWYSFDWGNVHVVVLDALGGDPEQLDWLERDLRASDRPWRIAVAPTPPYSSGFHGSYGGFRRDFEPIFQRHDVQLVVSGDDHHYERTEPIGGVTYIVTGGGGRSVRSVGTSAWTEFSITVFHFVYVSIEGDTMRVHAIDATGREFDGVAISR